MVASPSLKKEAARMKAAGRAIARGDHVTKPRGTTARTRRSGALTISISRPRLRKIHLRG